MKLTHITLEERLEKQVIYMTKKIVVVIVEGPSDEALLMQRLKEIFYPNQIRFRIFGGDIFNSDKIRGSIKNGIGDLVKSFVRKSKLKEKDILTVIHICDTDGCFISEDSVTIDVKQAKCTRYNESFISVNSEKQKLNIVNRNTERSRKINTMAGVDSIVAKKYKYQLYFFSRNLEHVIFNEPNPVDEVKCENIDDFIDELTINLEDYLMDHINYDVNVDYSKKYTESWKQIRKKSYSLSRFTNTPLMWDHIKSLLEENKK